MCFDFESSLGACVVLWVLVLIHPDPRRRVVLAATSCMRAVEVMLWHDHYWNPEECSVANWAITSFGFPFVATLQLLSAWWMGKFRNDWIWGGFVVAVVASKWMTFWNSCTSVAESVFLGRVFSCMGDQWRESGVRLVAASSSPYAWYSVVGFWVATFFPFHSSASWRTWIWNGLLLAAGLVFIDALGSVLCVVTLTEAIFSLLCPYP